jgi:hypothetical protein
LPEDTLPKQFFGAWINQLRKIGQLQLTFNNNFTKTLKKILPGHIKSREAIFKECLKITKDELQWKQIIKEYFEKCKTVEENSSYNSSKNTENENCYNYGDW